MIYKIEFSKRSYKYLNRLDQSLKNRISQQLEILSENPRNPELDIKKLQGNSLLYRLRVGNYRILYTIEDDLLIIVVINIGPRGDVYNDL